MLGETNGDSGKESTDRLAFELYIYIGSNFHSCYLAPSGRSGLQ